MNATRAVVVFDLMLSVDTAAQAHRRDEYLQSATISVERNRGEVEITLTPGIDVAPGVIASVDTDADGAIADD